jgi:hypothetical protein
MQSEHLKHDDQNRKSARASQHQDDISVGSEQFHRHVFSFSISTNSFSCQNQYSDDRCTISYLISQLSRHLQ